MIILLKRVKNVINDYYNNIPLSGNNRPNVIRAYINMWELLKKYIEGLVHLDYSFKISKPW